MIIAIDSRSTVGQPAVGPTAVLVTSLSEVRPRPRKVAVGNFDGVHPGHAAVIAGCDTVLTFARADDDRLLCWLDATDGRPVNAGLGKGGWMARAPRSHAILP